jgi:hypothetical protein
VEQLTTTAIVHLATQLAIMQQSTATFTPTNTPTKTPTYAPSRTPTQTSMPTSTNTSTPVPLEFTTINNSGCRKGPGSVYAVTKIIDANTSVLVVGKSPSDLGDWWMVRLDGEECWVNGTLGTMSSVDTGGIEIAAVPPTPSEVMLSVQVIQDAGSVSSRPNGIWCHNGGYGVCSALFPTNSQVELILYDSGSFWGWEITGDPGCGKEKIWMNNNKLCIVRAWVWR